MLLIGPPAEDAAPGNADAAAAAVGEEAADTADDGEPLAGVNRASLAFPSFSLPAAAAPSPPLTVK